MFASVFWVLSVATIFVPGALEIQAQGPAFNETRNVPLIDVNYRPTPGGDIIDPRISRNLTMAKQAFFHSNYESVYQ